MKRKGFVLTLDAVISMMFILVVFIALSTYRYANLAETTTTAFINLHYVSEDLLDVLNKQGILDTIGQEWTEGNQSFASNLSRQYLDKLVPPNMGYRLTFDGEEVAANHRVSEDRAMAVTHSVRLLAGYEANRTTTGSVARAFLTGIKEKTNSAYAYFGGSVGLGDITKYLYVPNGVTITGATMDMNIGSSFRIKVGGSECPLSSPYIVGSVGSMTANVKDYDISDCGFANGPNKVEIEFMGGPTEQQFIGGGFIKVTYKSNLTNETVASGSDRYEFPGIDGYVNHHSSFYVPGTLNSIDIHLNFYNEYTTFLKIGDVLVFNSSGGGGQIVDLSDSYLRGKLNYNTLKDNTVPIKLGTSNITEVADAGNADVVLITDLSDSMIKRLDDDSIDGTIRGCDDAMLLAGDTRRVSLAKCMDKEFINIILNSTGNRVALVGFTNFTSPYHDLSTDNASLMAHVDAYSDDPSGERCICCAINRAYDILNSQSSPERDKFIIVMSDGVTGNCCGVSGWWWWATCDDQGTSDTARYHECDGNTSDCTGAQCNGAITNAIWSTQRARTDLGATLHSIGFGQVVDCDNGNFTLQQIATAGGGIYCGSSSGAGIRNCYDMLASGIAQNSTKLEIVDLRGSLTPSTLYADSYIDYSYTPRASPLGHSELALSYETDRFNDNTTCLGGFYIPSDVEVIDAKATSYSSEHWTHYTHILNSMGLMVSYRLSDYGSDYSVLGDPYIIQMPIDYIRSGENNTIKLTTGDSPSNETGCSVDNRAIITIRMGGSTGYGNAFPEAEGCNWEIEFEDGTNVTYSIPPDYTGTSQCRYTSGNVSCGGVSCESSNDAVNNAVYRLFRKLDLDDDGQLEIKLDQNNVLPDPVSTGGVRSLWGPAQIKLVVWI